MTEHVIVIIMGSICIIGLGFAFLNLLRLSVEVYFLRFRLERHPVLINMIEDVLDSICREEGIRVYYKSYEDLNKDCPEDKERALGKYVYTCDAEYQKAVDNALHDIENLELKYRKSYPDICALAGVKCNSKKEDYVLPRILLCDEKLLTLGLGSYYSTYFHELGHHFAAKLLKDNHTEKDADIQAVKLIQERLPQFLQAIPYFNFQYRIEHNFKLTQNKLKAYLEYLKYYVKNKKSIVKL
jgi:hypothetical protein